MVLMSVFLLPALSGLLNCDTSTFNGEMYGIKPISCASNFSVKHNIRRIWVIGLKLLGHTYIPNCILLQKSTPKNGQVIL